MRHTRDPAHQRLHVKPAGRSGRGLRRVGAAFLALSTFVEGPATALTPTARAIQTQAVQGLSLRDADIADAANIVFGTLLHRPFVIDPAATGKVSLEVPAKATTEQVLEALERALLQSDVVFVQTDGVVTITKTDRAKALAKPETYVGEASIKPGFHILAAPVSFGAPADMVKSLQAAGHGGAVLGADDSQGLLILGGPSVELRAALSVLHLMDRNRLKSGHVRIVELKAAAADAVASELAEVMSALGISGATAVAVPRLHAVIVTARSDEALQQMLSWIGRVDTPSLEEKTALWLYRPHNISVDALADTLGQLLGGAMSKPSEGDQSRSSAEPALSKPVEGQRAFALASSIPPDSVSFQPGLGREDIKIGVNKETNTLMVMAPESRWRALKAILDDMDRTPEQVLIEATVLEVTLSDQFRLGVDWSVVGAGGKLNVVSNGAAADPPTSGLNITYVGNTVSATVDALSAKTHVRVVSAPKLVTVDNHTATLQVGDQVPIINQAAQSTAAAGAPLVVNTEYRDTGVIMKIKPRITGSDSVQVDFSQEVSGVAKTTSSSINSPTIQQRKFAATLTVSEGQTVALGGLISSQNSRTDAGIPGLTAVPILGSLFRDQNTERDRTEIIVLLSAKIMHAPSQSAPSLDVLKAKLLPKGIGDAEAR